MWAVHVIVDHAFTSAAERLNSIHLSLLEINSNDDMLVYASINVQDTAHHMYPTV